MDKALISIIIPIYNAEKYLSRSVGSALAQNGCDFEIVLVDDGATDGSGQICDDYAAKNPIIQVVHKKNGGISSARNAGIAAAKGEYLLFLDADDSLEPDTCAVVSAVIEKYRPDCIDFGWSYVSAGGEITHNLHKLPKNVLLGEDTLKELILPPLLNLRKDDDHFIFDFSCTKVFRKDLIVKNRVAFDEGRRIWEDRPFVVSYLRYCRSFYSIDRCLYRYMDVPGSLSRRYSMDFFRIIVENFRLYQTLFGQDYDFDTPYVNNHWCGSVENMIHRSLEQQDNRAAIRANMIDYLGNPQIVYWFANRTTEDPFRKKVASLIASGQPEKALNAYEQEAAAAARRNRVQSVTAKIRRGVKKLIGR